MQDLEIASIVTGVARPRWCVNVVGGKSHDGSKVERNWADAREYGFVSAGGSGLFRNQISKLAIGEEFLAYVKGTGVVGVGVVLGTAVPISTFIPRTSSSGKTLLKQKLRSKNLNHDASDLANCEYCVTVHWRIAVDENAACPDLTFGERPAVWELQPPRNKAVDRVLRHFRLR